MKQNNRQALWRLPDGMDEMLPGKALALEGLRRAIYDLHLSWGYQPVEPPFVEFLDSLLSGTGRDFERQTFKVSDPLSGLMMGVRADMTPQVARIDAHQMHETDVAKLFYLGTVIRAHTEGVEKNRAPLQIGAEIFGHAGPQSDVEVIRLMLSVLLCAGIDEVHLDLGHAGIFRSLCTAIDLSDRDQSELFSLLQKKAVTDIVAFSAGLGLAEDVQTCLTRLCGLNGDCSILERAVSELGALAANNPAMTEALDELQEIGNALQSFSPDINLHIDLAEVRGYQYHTGVVFAAYTPGSGSEIARGGRYDGIGESFGRARPATGYSTDLKLLMRLAGFNRVAEKFTTVSAQSDNPQRAILCPDENCTELVHTVEQLRSEGEVVVFDLAGLNQSICDRVIRRKDGAWLVEKL